MFELGLSSYSYGWAVSDNRYTHLSLLEKTEQFGLHVVQYGDNLPLHELDDQSLGFLGEQAKQKGIAIETGTRGFSEENLACYAEISQKLGSNLMRILIDDGENWHPDLDTVLSIFKNFESTLAAANVRVGIENHDRFLSADLARLVSRADSRYLGICLDTVNSLGAAESLQTVIDNLLPHAINIHVKDFMIRRFPHKQGFEVIGCPCGKGMLRVEELMRLLMDRVEIPHFIFEQWVVPEATMDETVAKENKWADEGILYLKNKLS